MGGGTGAGALIGGIAGGGRRSDRRPRRRWRRYCRRSVTGNKDLQIPAETAVTFHLANSITVPHSEKKAKAESEDSRAVGRSAFWFTLGAPFRHRLAGWGFSLWTHSYWIRAHKSPPRQKMPESGTRLFFFATMLRAVRVSHCEPGCALRRSSPSSRVRFGRAGVPLRNFLVRRARSFPATVGVPYISAAEGAVVPSVRYVHGSCRRARPPRELSLIVSYIVGNLAISVY